MLDRSLQSKRYEISRHKKLGEIIEKSLEKMERILRASNDSIWYNFFKMLDVSFAMSSTVITFSTVFKKIDDDEIV